VVAEEADEMRWDILSLEKMSTTTYTLSTLIETYQNL